MGKARLTALLVCLGLAILLPLLGSWLRRGGNPGCTLDGQAIDPRYRVRLMDADHQSKDFCCLVCAELWLKRQGKKMKAIYVTDETSGQEIPADEAFFVRSLVFTNKTTQNRVHVFRHRTDAQQHAQQFLGTLLPEDEKPFAKRH